MPQVRQRPPRARTVELERHQIRAALEPSTFDAEALTIEGVATTGEEVPRYNYELGRFMQSLSLEPRSVRLGRMNAGASVIDQHQVWGGVQRELLGIVQRAWIDGNSLRVQLKLSSRQDLEGFRTDVRTGIARWLSLDYVVHKYEDRTEREGGTRRFHAIDWEPVGISFVLIAAEGQTSTRSADRVAPCVIETRNRRDMDEEVENFGAGVTVTDPPNEARSQQPPAAPPAPPAAPHRAPAPSPAPTPAPVDARSIADEARRAERARVADVQARCAELGLSAEFQTRMISEGHEGTNLTLAIQGEYIRQHRQMDTLGDGVRPRVAVGREQSDKLGRSIMLGMAERMAPRALSQEEVREVGDARHMSLCDMAGDFLVSRGYIASQRGIDRADLAQRAMSTSDFPIFLQQAGLRTLLDQYAAVPPTWKPWVRENADVPDFRTIERARISDVPKPVRVPEGGDYPEVAISETKEGYKLLKYGHIVPFTWESMINDDLGALRQSLATEATMISELEGDIVYNELTSPQNMADGNGPFHASRSNTDTQALDEDALTTLVKLLALQRTKSGKDGRPLNVRGRFILVPPELEVTAMKLVTAVIANTTGAVNVHAGRFEVISEARLHDASVTAWYLVADPARMPTLEVGYLRGHGAPEFFQEQGFQNDSIRFKVRRVIGAKFIEYRGIAKSTGTT